MTQGFDKTFPATMAGIVSDNFRNQFAALQTNNAGNTPPDTGGASPQLDPETGWPWWKSDTKQLYVYDGTSFVLVADASGLESSIVWNDSKMTRQSSTIARLSENGGKKSININGEIVDLDGTDYDVTVGTTSPDNVLDTAAPPLANTTYPIYCQNSTSGGGSPRIILSTALPDSLGRRSGDLDSQLVGAVHLDGSVEIAEEWNLVGYGFQKIRLNLPTTIERLSGTFNTYYPVLNMSDVVMIPGTRLMVQSYVNREQTSTTGPEGINANCRLLIDSSVISTSVKSSRGGFFASSLDLYDTNATSVSTLNIDSEYQYAGGSATIKVIGEDVTAHSENTKIDLLRESIYIPTVV